MKRRAALLVLVLLFPAVTLAFEFRTHNGVTAAARSYLVDKHPELFDNDPDFKRFLQLTDPDGYNLIDSAAGDPFEGASLDEDHREGYLLSGGPGACTYLEGPCRLWEGVERAMKAAPCTLDHFRKPLRPLPGRPATKHARYYFDLAYRLYVAARCATDPGLRDGYFRGAASALGHALHLIEDMASPQHVRPENHGLRPWGHGLSFLEGWARGASGPAARGGGGGAPAGGPWGSALIRGRVPGTAPGWRRAWRCGRC